MSIPVRQSLPPLLGAMALLLVGACRSTDPGPDLGPLPEPQGKLLVYHYDNAEPGFVIVDLSAGRDTVVMSDRTGKAFESSLRTRYSSWPLPSLLGTRRVSYHGRMVLSRLSLDDGVVTDLYDIGSDHVSNPGLKAGDPRAMVVLGSHQVAELDLASGALTAWLSAVGPELFYYPQYDPISGGLLVTSHLLGKGRLVQVTSPGNPPTVVVPEDDVSGYFCGRDVAADGRIVYSRVDGTFRILLRQGVGRRDTLVAGLKGICPTFSPDGEFLAYLNENQVWLYRFRDGRITPAYRGTASGSPGLIHDWW